MKQVPELLQEKNHKENTLGASGDESVWFLSLEQKYCICIIRHYLLEIHLSACKKKNMFYISKSEAFLSNNEIIGHVPICLLNNQKTLSSCFSCLYESIIAVPWFTCLAPALQELILIALSSTLFYPSASLQ